MPLGPDDSSSPCPDALDDAMGFDHIVYVREDGTVTEPRGVPAPELERLAVDEDGQIVAGAEGAMLASLRRGGWEAMTGYTGQYGYRGPVMHSSEYIGGRMARDILAEPGLYVALVVECEDDEIAGWLVAYRHEGESE